MNIEEILEKYNFNNVIKAGLIKLHEGREMDLVRGNALEWANKEYKELIKELNSQVEKEREEAVRGFEESIFFGDTIIVDGKTYVSMEHIQKVKDNYLTKKGRNEEKRK